MRRLILIALLFTRIQPVQAKVRVQQNVQRQLVVPGHIEAMAQGMDGFLWLGTTAGLFRFDGLGFRHIADQEGRFAGISGLTVAQDGTVWASTIETVLRWHDGVLEIVASNVDRGFKILMADGPFIWASSTGGLTKLRNGNQVLLLPELDASTTLARDCDGGIWFAGSHGFGRLIQNKPNFLYTETAVRAVAALSPREVVFSPVGHGLMTWRSGVVAPMTGWLANHDVHQILVAPSGELWLGSGSGIARGREGHFVGVVSEQRLPQAPPTALFMDHEDSLWIAMGAEGLAQLAMHPLIRPLDLPTSSRPVFGLAVADDGFWALDPMTGLIHADEQGSTLVPIKNNSRFFSARGLVKAHDGTLWIGNLQKGVQRLKDGTLQDVSMPDSAIRGVHALYEDSGSVMWAAPDTGGMLRFDGKTFVPVPLPTVGNSRISEVIEHSTSGSVIGTADRLVLVTKTQLHKHNGHKWQVFSAPNWPGLDLRGIAIDGKGGYWIAGSTAGLVHFDGRAFERLDSSAGIPMTTVESVATTGKNVVALASRQGLVVVLQEELHQRLTEQKKRLPLVRWDAWDALPSSMLLTGWSGTLISDSADGFFATTNGGPVWIPDAAALATLKLPEVTIDSAEVDGSSILQISVSPARGANRLVVGFAAPSFLHAHRLRFEHRLRGLHDDWISAGEARQAVYPNLSPGKYTFEVRNAFGSSERRNVKGVKSISFELRPPLHRSRGVLFAMVALFLLGVSAALRTRRQQRIRAKAAIESERVRIGHDLHDTLEQTMVAVGFQLQAVESQIGDASSMNKHLGRARELLTKGMVQARGSIWSLQSAGAGPADLAGVLSVSIGQVLRDSNVQLRSQVTGTPWEISGKAKGEIERIVGEAVTNALKYAKAPSIDLLISFEPNRLIVKVRDDGQGFDPAHVKTPRPEGGLGLGGMQARAARLGAIIRYSSSPGNGTTVSLELPRNALGKS